MIITDPVITRFIAPKKLTYYLVKLFSVGVLLGGQALDALGDFLGKKTEPWLKTIYPNNTPIGVLYIPDIL